MTKQEIITEGYSIDDNGIITDLGKFEAEPYYIIHYYDIYMNGCAEDISDDCVRIEIDADDRKQFPELKGKRNVYLYFSDSGFVSIDCR
jgi:hypothetical protein